MKLFKHYIYPVVTISGSIIGVGFLALPYIAVQVGLLPMLLYMALITAFVAMVHHMLAVISLNTPDFKRWPGFIKHYFGGLAGRLIMIPMTVGLFGTMLIYLIVGSQFLTALLSSVFGGNQMAYALLYAVLASMLIFLDIRAISRFAFWSLAALLFSFFLIFTRGFAHMDVGNLIINAMPKGSGFKNLLLPYTAIAFSLWGTMLIPEVEEMLRPRKATFKRVVLAATLLPALIYTVFIVMVVAITGGQTTESALIGLARFLGPAAAFIVLFIGALTTFTAFLSEGLLLKKIFMYDLKMGTRVSWAITCMVPVLLFLAGFRGFIPLVGFIGGILLSIDGLLITVIYQKVGGSRWVAFPLVVFFISIMILQLL